MREIKLELLVDKETKLKVEGLCCDETPNMSTVVSWFNFAARGIKKKGLKDAVTLFEKYSQMISYANEKYPKRSYKIKMLVEEEKNDSK